MIKAIEVNVKKSIVIIIILLLIGLAILAQNRQKPFVDKHECVGCKDCVEACPVHKAGGGKCTGSATCGNGSGNVSKVLEPSTPADCSASERG